MTSLQRREVFFYKALFVKFVAIVEEKVIVDFRSNQLSEHVSLTENNKNKNFSKQSHLS
jgi:hypothetical protein